MKEDILSVRHTAEAVQQGSTTAQEVVEQAVERINAWDSHIHAFLEVCEDDAKKQAERVDSHPNKEAFPLAGVPIAIKDNICTTEGKTRAASKILENFTSPYDATVITRLKKAGAIVIGKTNLDEFAMGSSTEYSAYGPTYNPWDVTRIPGGSSGGSIASVASGEAPAALGTDTGGSIRQPASMCNVVGLKPTYGRVSRFGAIAYGSSLDQIGPIARTVQDVALLLSVMAGQDPYDATTSPNPVASYLEWCGKSVEGLRIGVPKEFFDESLTEGVRTTVLAAIELLKEQGAHITEISLPLTSAGVAVYYLIAKAEASVNLSRFDALRYGKMELEAEDLIGRYIEARGNGFGPEVKRAILMGTYALSAGYYDAWYKQASKVRTLIRKEYEEAFMSVDVIAAPVSPEVAFPLGSKTDDPLQMYLADALTVPMSVAGVPALSVPCGFHDGLPVGLQLAAPHFMEERLFQVGHAYETATAWHEKLPQLPQRA